jgi:hypothetical protein
VLEFATGVLGCEFPSHSERRKEDTLRLIAVTSNDMNLWEKKSISSLRIPRIFLDVSAFEPDHLTSLPAGEERIFTSSSTLIFFPLAKSYSS